MIDIRPFQPSDWSVLLHLANQAVPFAAQDNAAWLEYRKSFDETQRLRRHYLAVDGNLPVGYGGLEQQSDPLQGLRIYVVASPINLRGEVGARLYTQLLHDAHELRVAHLWAREFQKDEPAREFFLSRGFAETEQVTLPEQFPMAVYRLRLAV